MDEKKLQHLKLEMNSGTPLYLQLAQKLSEAIKNGCWQAGEALPSERYLAECLSISRVTARKGLDRLLESGLIKRCRGSGTFITGSVSQASARLISFSEMLRERGFASSAVWLSREVAAASQEEMTSMGLSPNSKVIHLKRLRYADQKAIALEHNVLPVRYVPNPSLIDHSLYDYLDTMGHSITRAIQQVSAINASIELSQLMGVEVGAALLLISRIGYLENNIAIELTKTHCLNEYYDFVAELRPN